MQLALSIAGFGHHPAARGRSPEGFLCYAEGGDTSSIGLGTTVRAAYTEAFHTSLAVLDGLSSGRTALRFDLRHNTV